MPTLCLPDKANLEHLKNQARELQRLVREGNGEAIAAVREHHPRPDVALSRPCTLADAQLVLSRSYGFASWPRIKRHLKTIDELTRNPHLVELSDDCDPGDRLLRLGCLTYGDDDLDRQAEARRLYDADPVPSTRSIWVAAATGDVDAARAFVAGDPSLARRSGGPFDWEPLLYLTYSRIGRGDPVALARLLLDHGANPNAGFLWEGLTSPFTALTGALGGGEDKTNQPPHPRALDLARVLLEAGADPNDTQGLYNRQFDGDISHLHLLFEFGLGSGDGGPWHERLGPTHQTPQELLDDQLVSAAAKGKVAWVRLLLEHGANPDGRGHPIFGGRTARELAVVRGHAEVARLLAEGGASTPLLSESDRFIAACMTGREGAVEELMTYLPPMLDEARAQRPAAVLDAAEAGRPDAVRLLASLGFDVNAKRRITALHQAAYDGDVELVQLLLELGADPTITDDDFHTPPLRWAEHTRQHAVADLLRPLTPVVP